MAKRKKPPSPARFDESQVLKLAVQNHKNGDFQKAKDLYLRLLYHNPRNADVIHRLGTMAIQIEQFDKAEDFIRQAIDIGPITPTMLINYGTALRNLKRYEEAISAFDEALERDPNNANAHYNKGRALIANEQFTEAIEANAKAIEADPGLAEAWSNLGSAQKSKGLHLESLYAFDKAAQINPNMPELYRNMTSNLLEMRLYEPAIKMCERAVDVDPDKAGARYFLNSCLLTSGNLEDAWADFGVRFEHFEDIRKYRRPVPPPYWNGSEMRGKRFLIWTEQGIGEAILAISVLLEFFEEVEDCTVECWDRLVPIFSQSFPGIKFASVLNHKEIVENAETPFDFQMPALDLLTRYRPSIETFPKAKPFIKPNPEITGRLRAKYEEMAQGKRIVGMSWKSTSEKLGRFKSSVLEDWHNMIANPDLFFVNLQYGDYEEEWANYTSKYPCTMFDDPDIDPIGNLEDAVAQIAAMDLVISVSNSNVHIAGALGIPTWLLLPNSTSTIWYWFLDRTDSPWYPSVRIFRQKSMLDEERAWLPEAIEDMFEALQVWMDKPLPPRLVP
ncbi:MAG: tetratricopeptide repeat protein [Rhodospirillaceae bacterium]